MWYKIDFTELARQLLPPVLRSGVLMALLKVLVSPIKYLFAQFDSYRTAVEQRLERTANVQYLQKVLLDAFFLKENEIYIESGEEQPRTVLYQESEGQAPAYVGGTATFVLRQPDEVPVHDTFVIYVPSFLCTSITPAEDQYGGANLRTIVNLLNQYKPAGRTYRIEIYDYE